MENLDASNLPQSYSMPPKNNKTFWIFTIVFLSILLILIFFLINLLNKKQIKNISYQSSDQAIITQTPTPIPDPYAGWYAFTSSKKDYSLNYPKEWKLTESKRSSDNLVTISCDIQCNADITIKKLQIRESLIKSFDEYKKSNRGVASLKEITINGIPALEAFMPSSVSETIIQIFILYNYQGYIITLFPVNDNYKSLDDFPPINPDILSTFKFL